MSRPPTMQAPQENPYNGGLIDFHESALRADLSGALYAHQLAAAHQAQYAPAYPVQAQAHHSHPHAHAYAPQAAPYQSPLQPQYAPVQPVAPAVQSMMMAQAPGQCIAGPPAFLHLHGQVYAPIEESVAPAAEPALKEKPAAAPSGKALDRLVEQRVEQRVNEYFSKKAPKGLGASVRNKRQQPKPDSLKELNGAMRARLSAY